MSRNEQQIRSQIAEIERYMLPFKRQIRTLKRALRKAKGLPAKRKGMGCRIGDRDVAATQARNFLDPASFVRTDGSEVCKGKDWLIRKGELRERSGGRCEYMANGYLMLNAMVRCSKAATIPAHIEPRYPKRDDRLSNLKHYCFEHDRLMEKQSWRRTRFGEVKSGKVDA